jgi:hypothetical protein
MITALPRQHRSLLLLFLSVGALLSGPLLSQDATPPASPAPPVVLPPASSGADRLPGVALAEGITQITGVAISPLLGVCGVGTWQYFSSTPEQRLALPWFCHPLAWGIGFGILSLGLLKDVFGAALPAILKKPLDLVELFEDKLSALVASAAFLPFLTSELMSRFGSTRIESTTETSALATTGLAAITPAILEAPGYLALLILPFSLIAFFAVWLTSHSLNVLLLLSPFSILDLFLKVSRVLVLGAMGLLYFISPLLAAILCGIVIAIAIYLAPRSFRLCVFGTVMSVDFLRSLIRKGAGSGKTRAFLARQSSAILPARTFGTLTRNNQGRIVFSSRFLLVGPRRILTLPVGENLSMQKGFLFPSVRVRLDDSEKTDTLLHLLPRHRHDLEAVAATLGIGAIHDHYVGRGVAAMKRWVDETFHSGGRLIGTQDNSTSP